MSIPAHRLSEITANTSYDTEAPPGSHCPYIFRAYPPWPIIQICTKVTLLRYRTYICSIDTWRRNNGGHLCTSASGMASLSASSSYAISKRRRIRSSKNLLIVLLWKRHSNIIFKRIEAGHDSYQWGRSPAFVFFHVGDTATWSGNFFRWVFINQCILLSVAVGAVIIIVKCVLKTCTCRQ